MTTSETTNTTPLRVAILGGGITGLSVAWYLQQQSGSRPIHYTVLEKSARWGGKVATETISGYGEQPFVVEVGPDSFLTQKPWALQLARELGLGDRLLPTNDHLRKTFVLNRGKMTPLPDGVMLIVPTKIMPFATSPLFSIPGKLRMALEPFIPAKRDGQDETLSEFVGRRLGREAVDKLAEPLLAGIFNADAERQSILATFPRFREMEAKHGSLVKGMLAARKQRAVPPPSANGGPPKAPVSTFMSLRGGVQELTDTLVDRLTGDLRLQTGVSALTRLADGGYTLQLDDGSALSADVVILALPAGPAAHLLQPLAPQAAALLGDLRYVSTGTISLAFRRDEVAHPLDGFGVVIPRSEGRPINAITWTSTKFHHRVPEGYVMVRVFFGGSRSPESMELSDLDLEKLARAQLAEIMGIRATPTLHRIYRWTDAQPQYDVGHLQRVGQIEAALPADLFLTGSPYRGVGLPDCVRQAKETAQKVAG